MKLRETFTKIKIAGTGAILSLATTLPIQSFATGVVGNGTSQANDSIKNIISMAVTIASGLFAAILLCIGVYKLILAFRHNQPNESSAAIKDVICGALFAALAIFINPILSAFM